MAERKFIRNLTKPGSAAVLRENVSAAVRHTTLMVRPQIPDPIDYESFASKYREILQNDPQRELLLFPMDDFTIIRIRQEQRTIKLLREVAGYLSPTMSQAPLYVKDCLDLLTRDWSVLKFKHGAYSGSWIELPRSCKAPEPNNLEAQVFEMDEETNEENDINREYIVKEGFILKGSEAGTDSFISVATKLFKRRWMTLRQEIDGTCMLEFHKDQRKVESKGAICLDFCATLVKNSRKGKLAFELRMSEGHKTCVLVAENEQDYEEWLDVLSRSLTIKSDTSSRKSVALSDDSASTPPLLPKFGTLRSLERQQSPELIKYTQENDYIISQQRKENRHNICTVYPDLYARKGTFTELSVANEQRASSPTQAPTARRIQFTCERIEFNLKMTSETGASGFVEPLFTSVAVYDVRRGKITEEFKFDVNDECIKEMLPRRPDDFDEITSEKPFSDAWVMNPASAIFSLYANCADLYLVMRIEKIFSGGISSTSEAYLKSGQNGTIGKLGIKLQKSAKATCQKMNHLYRMPFAWAAKPLFKLNGALDMDSDFGCIYRQDGHKLSDEDLLKHLAELRHTERLKNITLIPGRIRVHLQDVTNVHLPPNNVLSSSHVPLAGFEQPPTKPAIIEIQEYFSNDPSIATPFTSFVNMLYVFPKHLRYDVQKLFPKAKNICCAVEFRDNDSDTAQALPVIFGSPGQGENEFVSRVITSVTHHNNNPEFYEEIKILLPAVLNDKQHLLFSFYHVSSSSLLNKKKEGSIQTSIGYAWMPIYPTKGKLAIEEAILSIASHLPSGYLSYKPLGLGHGFSGPEIKWVDGGREAFKVDFRLVSSIFPKDVHLHSFFVAVDKMLDTRTSSEESVFTESDADSFTSDTKRMSVCSDAGREISKFVQIQNGMPKILKSIQDADICDLIRFFPVLITQLLKLLITTTSGDVSQNIIRTIIQTLSQLNQVQKQDVVETYVQYVFTNEHFTSLQLRTTLHEEIVSSLVALLRGSNVDFILINKLLAHMSFFLRLCVKSMACHLLETQRVKMHRHERFPLDFHTNLSQLVDLLMPEIMKKYNVLPKETKCANAALGHFIARLFSLMDRGYVFKLIKLYLDKFHSAKDSIPLHTYKFEFLAIVSSYEHYVPLNLPLNFSLVLKSLSPDGSTMDYSAAITEDYCRNHFLTGVLLREIRSALAEVHQVRGMALSVLRNLVVKHSIDERYSSPFQQSRIASLYFPFISLIQENLNRIHIPGFVNAFLPLLSAKRMSNNAGSVYNLNLYHSSQSSLALGSTRSSKRISLSPSEKFNSLNSETSSILVQSLKRNSSLDGSSLGNGSVRDSGYLNLIAGTMPLNARMLTHELVKMGKRDEELTMDDDEHNDENGHSDQSRSTSPYSHSSHSSTTTLTAMPSSTIGKDDGCNHVRSHSLPIRFDKLNAKEVRDLLITFLWLCKHAAEECLVGWLRNATDAELTQILTIMEMSLHEFKYEAKRASPMHAFWKTEKSATLPTKMTSISNKCATLKSEGDMVPDDLFSQVLEANLSGETGLIVLDLLGLITAHLQSRLDEMEGDNALMRKVFSLHLCFFKFKQSEKLLQHLFASLRLFVHKFTLFLFAGSTEHINRLCVELLRFCSSRLSAVRSDAAILLYLLLRANFNYTGRQAITRMHLQLVISISQLLGSSLVEAINNPRFQESLSMINNYASSDKSIGNEGAKFTSLVKELIKNIRTVLMATVAMREHEHDHEKLLDLQHHLADSYRDTSPALRRTWLQSMAANHVKNGHLSEAAQCYAHIAALEYVCLRIRQRELQPVDFTSIGANIERDERNCLSRREMLSSDVFASIEQQFSLEQLIQSLRTTIDCLAQAERFEVIPEVYKILLPLYERRREFETLAIMHKSIAANYEKIVQLQKSGRRFLGKYYRVGFYGRDYFDEDSGCEFIYKEEKVTSLSEISQRLGDLYTKKHGVGNIKLIQSEREIDESKDCDPRYGYIQITHVIPYDQVMENSITPAETGEEEEFSIVSTSRETVFERAHNIKWFMFETPFCLSDPRKARSSSCEDQAKKRTCCRTTYEFPYVLKRIPICEKRIQVLSPIEVAIDEMQARVNELHEVIFQQQPDLKRLHLKLGGSISVQVNAGPLAYAKAFINSKYPEESVQQLKNVYRQFVQVCEVGLHLNEQLIGQEQQQYHESLKHNFEQMVQELADYQINDVQVDADGLLVNKSFRIFDFISGSSNA